MKKVAAAAILIALFLLTAIYPAQASQKSLPVEIVKGVNVEIPLPPEMPQYKSKPNNDVYSLFDSNAIAWTYRRYQKVDMNGDGQFDYYIVIEARFGYAANSLEIKIEWNKKELTPEERASIKKETIISFGGVPGKDYEPLFYDFAKQYMTYRLISDKEKISAFLIIGRYTIRESPNKARLDGESDMPDVSSVRFGEFLKQNIK